MVSRFPVPGTEVPESSYGVVRPGQDELHPFTPATDFAGTGSPRMSLVHPAGPDSPERDLAVEPLFRLEGDTIPRHGCPTEMPPDVAYQIVHDELMLDGNARLNLATFVSTWMEPQARQADGRVLRQEHDRQGRVPADRGARDALREHARRLWHAPDAEQATGCSTTGSSEAAMLGGLALKRRWQKRRAAGASRPTSRTSSWASTSRCAGRSSPTTGTSRRGSCRWRATASTSRPRRR